MLVDTSLLRQLSNLADRLFTTSCSLCGSQHQVTGIVCQACIGDLPVNHHSCQICALPMTMAMAKSAGQQTCGACLTKPPQFDQVIAPLLYQPPVDGLISQLKYRQRLASGRTFAKLIGDHLRELPVPLPQGLIPVPLHKQRLQQRGYNQTQEIARLLATDLHLPLLSHSVIRHKATAHQPGCLQFTYRSQYKPGTRRPIHPPWISLPAAGARLCACSNSKPAKSKARPWSRSRHRPSTRLPAVHLSLAI